MRRTQRTSEEAALPLAIWLWDWFYEIKCLVTPLPTAFSLPNMETELSSSCFFFFHSKKKRKKNFLSNPRTPVPSICLHFIEWLSMCEKKMAETRRIRNSPIPKLFWGYLISFLLHSPLPHFPPTTLLFVHKRLPFDAQVLTLILKCLSC